MYSFTEENYLKAIYKLSGGSEEASTNAISEELQTKAASVTDMLKKLADKKLIHYERYKGVSLTEKGRDIAVTVVRKHRLWEVFLSDHLHFGWDEVHEIAEQLEHIQSDALIDRLDNFLGNPKYDPHGDPIPDKEGKFHKDKFIQLSEAEDNRFYIMTGVSDHTSEFLKMLEKLGLNIGVAFRVKEIMNYDGSIEISFDTAPDKAVFLSNKVVSNITVKKV